MKTLASMSQPPPEPCGSGHESAPSELLEQSEPTHVGCYSAKIRGGNPSATLPAAPVAGFSRRRFLETSVVTLTGLGVGLPALSQPAASTAQTARASAGGVLRGFVVSDAHFGWANPQQPAPEEIKAAMQAVMRRFPDLDVFVDTGDATHSYGNDLDRGQWLEIIQGGCGKLPFHFITGNHDLAGPSYPLDPEHHVQTLGSCSCRPFFSFDLKGIHFVALPQLMVVSLVTREALEWLKLDLELNRDKTTIVFSHNALMGTTWKLGERGDGTYRQVANTDEVLAVFRRFPNVKAWMHGHNHDFVVVEKDGLLCVSNGRIGGFDPHKNTAIGNSLGGFLFEVGSEHLTVRAYAANKDKLLDEVPGFESLRHTLKFKTSFDPAAPAAISFGSGNSLDGQRWPIFNHYTLADVGRQELFLKPSEQPVINNDPPFTCFLEGWRGRDTPGYDIKPVLTDRRLDRRAKRKSKAGGEKATDRVDRSWEFLNPGIRLLKLDEPGVVRRLQSPGDRGMRSNWRCVPGRNYRVTVELDVAAAGPNVQLAAIVFDPQYREFARFDSGQPTALKPGAGLVAFDFTMPPLRDLPTIYTDAALDTTCYVTLEAAISNLVGDVIVRRFSFVPTGAGGESAVTLNGERFAAASNSIARHEMNSPMPSRAVAEITAPGAQTLTWLVRQTGLDFQVRNALVEDKGDHLLVTRLRNRFSQQEEIIIAPLTAISEPWVHRLRHVNRARLHRWNPQIKVLRIEPEEVFGVISADIVMAAKPDRVTGAEMWEHTDGLLRVWARGNVPVEIFGA
jgi:hypothetical protein